jgi:ubiquinone/menaquinone biosynthesis C-methylase UbiE
MPNPLPLSSKSIALASVREDIAVSSNISPLPPRSLMERFLQNQRAWDALADAKSQFANVATDAECAHPLLTLDTRGWLPGSVRGLQVLCLAAGGGWQSILYAVAGADVTVVDISESMLALDRGEAERRGVKVQTIQASMDDLSLLQSAQFDIVHQPVSTCYVDRLEPVYREVARVIKPGGLYISQHKQPTSLQIAERDAQDRYVIGISYYHRDPLPEVSDRSYRENGTVEDTTEQTATIAERWHAARAQRESGLRDAGGNEAFERLQGFLAVASQLARERRLRRYMRHAVTNV